jgi:hypothetical protein
MRRGWGRTREERHYSWPARLKNRNAERSERPRLEAKNTAWVLTGEQADTIREHYPARKLAAMMTDDELTVSLEPSRRPRLVLLSLRELHSSGDGALLAMTSRTVARS